MQTNIKWIKKAAEYQNLDFKILSIDGGFAVLNLAKPYYFVNCATPFNREDFSRLVKDKFFTYLTLKDFVKMPKTLDFIDPKNLKNFDTNNKFSSIEEISDFAINQLSENIIIKKNSGQRKENVFFPKNREEINIAFEQIYNQNSKNYDYIALAQEKINIKQEFRVLVGYNEVLLIYKKWKFIKVTDINLIQKIEDFISKITQKIDINFSGLDIALDQNEELVLIELNSAPRLDLYIMQNGEQEVIKIFQFLLEKFKFLNS